MAITRNFVRILREARRLLGSEHACHTLRTSQDIYTARHFYGFPSLRWRGWWWQNRYCFWYYRKGAQKESKDPSEAYESGIKVVDSFQTVEHFWRIYNHILRADQVC